MRRLDDCMTGVIDALALLPGLASKEEEDHTFAFGVDAVDHRVGEPFPAAAGVGCRLAITDGEHDVQEQDAPACPRLEVAVVRYDNAGVLVKLAEQVAEGWRRLDAACHREGQPMGLSGLMVGVLPEKDGTDPPARGEAQRLEKLPCWRIYRGRTVFCGQKRLELAEVGAIPLGLEGEPAGRDRGHERNCQPSTLPGSVSGTYRRAATRSSSSSVLTSGARTRGTRPL